MVTQPEADELISWIESQPELDYLRKQANKSLCEYFPENKTPQERIKINPRDEIEVGKEGFLRKFVNSVWVPAQNLRGKTYSSKELDGSLTSVSKVLSISTLWDFFCTLPIFYFAASFLAPIAALPLSILLGYLILWGSNLTGENSTNRTKGNSGRANASLLAFLILSLAKTSVSGVGTDMIISKEAIMEAYAEELVEKKSIGEKGIRNIKKEDSKELILATKQCESIQSQMNQIDTSKRQGRKTYQGMEIRAFGSQLNIDQDTKEGLSPQQIIQKYGANLPPCRKANVLASIEGSKNQISDKDYLKKVTDKNNLSSLAYLYRYHLDEYFEYFRGRPAGQLKQQWVNKESGALAKDKYGNNTLTETDGKLEWANGSLAVEQTTKQFFNKLTDPNKIASLGLSLFALVISIILTSTAAILLYTSSKTSELKASFSQSLAKKSNQLISSYRRILKIKNTET